MTTPWVLGQGVEDFNAMPSQLPVYIRKKKDESPINI